MIRIFTLFAILALVLSACTIPGDIEIHQAWVRPTAQDDNAAAYFTIHNYSANADELIGVTSTVADVAEIHESKIENDVMQMSMLTSLPIAAGQEIIFTPGGLHIMLANVKQELVLGENIGLILHFKNHADITVEVHIEDSIPAASHDH